jgi:8-oxo-dGTP diphosphatase
VVVVLEGAARRVASEGIADGVEVIHAPGAGDEVLAALAAVATEEVVLVSADRGLGDRVRRQGGELVGPRWLFERLV